MPQRRLSARSFALLIASCAVLVYLGTLFGFDGWLRSISSSLLRPIQRGFTVSVHSIQGWFQGGADNSLVDELEALRRERDQLLVRSAELQTSLDEARQAASEAEYLEERNFQFQVARAIGRSIDPNSRTITIDQGSARGIKVGQAVVLESGILIGRVSDITNSTSEVTLITDRRSRVAAMSQNERNSPGMIQGELGLSLSFELVPQDEPIAPDDLIVTSGLEPGIPRGLVIGRITTVHQEKTDIFQSASVSSPAQLDRMQIVSVIVQ